jgi:hypothetical protein
MTDIVMLSIETPLEGEKARAWIKRSQHQHVPKQFTGRCVEISDQVCVVPFPADGRPGEGYFFCHARPDGTRCTGGLAKHTVTGTLGQSDFNVSPSILCQGYLDCGGIHGFIRDGKWVPA